MPEPGASAITKHSLTIAGHRTSISLESAFWDGLRDIARARGLSLATLIGEIDATRGAANLSSAIRVYVLSQSRAG
jgi:predicted DNA-binding ribbon-helix-helix protein